MQNAGGGGIARHAVVAMVPVAVGYGLLATAVASRHGALTTYAGQSAAAAVVELAAGWALMAAGLLSWSRRPARAAGPLAVIAGFAWFAPDWIGWQTGPGAIRAVALAAQGVTAAALIQLALGAATGTPTAMWPRIVVAVAWTVTAAVGIGRALVYDPLADPNCVSWCAPNPLLVDGNRSFARGLDRVELALAVLAAAVVAILGIRRLARATPAARRALWPVVVPAGVFLGAWAVRVTVVAVTPGENPVRAVLVASFAVRAAALGTLAAGLLWSLARAARGALAVRRLAREPGGAASADSLEASLVRATGDSSLRVAFPLADGEDWIDTEGRPVNLRRHRAGTAIATVLVGGQPIAAVLHDPAILDGSVFEREIGTAGQLAVDNERLRAGARLQVRALRESRQRIVETSDAERRRLERDLHDGAQQHLVGLSVALRVAQTTLGEGRGRPAPASLTDAQAALQRAIAELRELAHGIHPVELSEEGLRAAIDSLADHAPILVGAVPPERLPAAVETAAYVLVDEVVRRAEARGDGTTLTVEARRADARLIVAVDDAGETSPDRARADLVSVIDRIGALGGTLSVEAVSHGGVRIAAEVPCA